MGQGRIGIDKVDNPLASCIATVFSFQRPDQPEARYDKSTTAKRLECERPILH